MSYDMSEIPFVSCEDISIDYGEKLPAGPQLCRISTAGKSQTSCMIPIRKPAKRKVRAVFG